MVSDLERWEPFPGFDNYEISDHGRVKNKKFDRVMTPHSDDKGFQRVTIYRDRRAHTKMVHRVVGEVYLDDYQDGLKVAHKNGDRKNCSVQNLEVTQQHVRRDGEK